MVVHEQSAPCLKNMKFYIYVHTHLSVLTTSYIKTLNTQQFQLNILNKSICTSFMLVGYIQIVLELRWVWGVLNGSKFWCNYWIVSEDCPQDILLEQFSWLGVRLTESSCSSAWAQWEIFWGAPWRTPFPRTCASLRQMGCSWNARSHRTPCSWSALDGSPPCWGRCLRRRECHRCCRWRSIPLESGSPVIQERRNVSTEIFLRG